MKYLQSLFIGFICSMLVFSCTEKTDSASEDPADIMVESIGFPINYQQCGTGEMPVVFVHGWCINQSYWEDQVDALCPDYRVITLDLPGFGNSKGEREVWSIENYGKDIVAVIDQLNLDNVVLVGHSMGGDIITEAALQRPDKVLALVGIDNFKDVGIEYSEADVQEMNGFMEMLQDDFSNIAPAYAQSMLFHASTDSLVAQRVMNDLAQADPEVAVETLQDLFDQSPKLQEKLGRVTQNLYLINSDATPTYQPGLDASGVGYEVNYIHATGHYPMVEKPNEFTEILKEVLGRIKAGSQQP